jgi:hypothetical protein
MNRDFVTISNADEVTGERHVRLHTLPEISDMYDMQDCDYMEDVAEILAIGSNGKLQPVHLGESRKINTDEEMPFRFASAPIITADGLTVGRVTFTDH